MSGVKHETIVLTGGHTGGPVAPLLALADVLTEKKPKLRFLFIGTSYGVERAMAKKAGIPFAAITAGKLRRYMSLLNVLLPFQLLLGFFQSYRLLQKANPLCVVGAGGFVQVPVCYAAWVLGVPVFIHQQDVLPSLSNKLCAPIARRVTVTFPESVNHFPHGWTLGTLKSHDRVVWTGNPSRSLKLPSQEKALKQFSLDHKYPTLLVLGGGSGALSLNGLIAVALPELTKYMNVLHLTGRGKASRVQKKQARYKAVEFLDDMGAAYAAADLVLCRAGLSTITELSAFKKAVLLVPMPGSHQEANALYLSSRGAAIAVSEVMLTAENIVTFLRGFLFEHRAQQELARQLHEIMPAHAGQHMARVILESL